MEWGHRILGRIIGLTFVTGLGYFALRRKIPSSLSAKLLGMSLLIGAQGLLGWYMVQSGLEESLMHDPNAVPRVSQYRLAAHLGTAFVLYGGMLATGLAVIKDWKFVKDGVWSGISGVTEAKHWNSILENPRIRNFKRFSWALTGLVFLTALSGMHSLLDATSWGLNWSLWARSRCIRCWP